MEIYKNIITKLQIINMYVKDKKESLKNAPCINES